MRRVIGAVEPVDFARLRLSGFKSFVEAADFRIEPGLTGVVGPNGCGKSNLLEAMRWVMGAASAKAMRGEGMDDVIFSGSTSRPARNHAEVTLTIDNAAGDAPAPFRSDPVLEVSRRIDRGAGSTFRVNGREVRARDVQLLFADASTGANSPALVRQGQISELIAAKPQNRRRILEEAAGVTGLYGRRHEAELRVAATDANLARLDDVAREIESGLARLRREARQAARYKALAAEIRALQGELLKRRWLEARAAEGQASQQAAKVRTELETATRAAAVAATVALDAEAAIKPLREEEVVAQAMLGRLAIDKDHLDRDLDQARREAERLAAELARLAEDDAREAAWLADADAALARLDGDAAALEAEIAAAPERAPALEAAAAMAETEREAADGAVEALAADLAGAEAEARAAESRKLEAEARLSRLNTELARARSERDAPAGRADPGLEAATTAHARASDVLVAARAEVADAETARGAAHAAEALARMKRRQTEDARAGAETEAKALARLTATAHGKAFPPALDQVRAAAGYEAALAAALGDDLNAAIDAKAPARWGGAAAPTPSWPEGAEPLAAHVEAPAELAARLAMVAVVAAVDGPRLQSDLPVGARLVSRAGDLWRWDGFTVRADAPRPAQARLEQKSRLAALEASLAEFIPAAEAAKAAHAEATTAVDTVETHLRAARRAQAEAEPALLKAAQALEALRRQAEAEAARGAHLAETVARLKGEAAEAEETATTRAAEAAQARVDAGLAEQLSTARASAGAAREAASRARLALDAELREVSARDRRLKSLRAERADWAARAASTAQRRADLETARETTASRLEEAREAPTETEARRARLLDELAVAEARKAKASDAVAAAETARADADRASRAAESRAADAREARAGAQARLDAARERLAEQAAALSEGSGVAPQELDGHFAGEASDGDLAPGAAEARLASLERDRDAVGPVNLRAEEEAAEQAARSAELAAERADLASALAKLRQAVGELNAEGRARLSAAFEVIHSHFRELFAELFGGGQAELRLVESDDPLEAGLEIFACPPGKRLTSMNLMSGGEKSLTAIALIFAVFLANPAPVCVLDEADAALDDANVERFCNLLAAMRARASTRFLVISHNALTMSRMDRLYGVTMREAGVSQLVSVDLHQAEAMAVQ